MTKNDAIYKLIGCDDISEAIVELLKENCYKGDEPCEFALLQISPRTPIYQAMEEEIARQEAQLKVPIGVGLEATCKGDPRTLVMFAMESLRECAKALTTPQVFKQRMLSAAIVCVLGVLWVEAWMLRLATVQTVRGLNRLVSPFHNENGDREA